MSNADAMSDVPLLCHRCGRVLTPGSTGADGFRVVRIEAFADPTPPAVDTDEPVANIGRDIDDLLADLAHCSEQELMDQVYRRLTMTLCHGCYATWIENPTG